MNGYSDATTITRYKILKFMAKNNVSLADPKAVKLFIALRKEWSNGHKQIAVSAYTMYAEMLKIEWKPPLQKRIVLHLAKSGAQTINETVSGLKGHYKSSWIAFNVLERKKIIKKVDMKIYRNRKYPRYWLTQAGIFVALVEGADAKNLLQRTIKTYPDDKTLQCVIEISPLVGLEGFRIALSAIQNKGKLDHSDMVRIVFSDEQKDVSIQQFKEFIRILKKYPEDYDRTKKRISARAKLLARIISMI